MIYYRECGMKVNGTGANNDEQQPNHMYTIGNMSSIISKEVNHQRWYDKKYTIRNLEKKNSQYKYPIFDPKSNNNNNNKTYGIKKFRNFRVDHIITLAPIYRR